MRYCLALLQAGLLQGAEGLAALGLPGFSAQGARQLSHQLLLLQPGDLYCSQASVTPESVAGVLELALARNLCLAGSYEEAVQLYQKLEGQGLLSASSVSSNITDGTGLHGAAAYSWISYGFAAHKLGQQQLCQTALESAVQAAAGQDVPLLHAVTALLQVRQEWLQVQENCSALCISAVLLTGCGLVL